MKRVCLAITMTVLLSCATDSAEQPDQQRDPDPGVAAGCVVRVSPADSGASIALADPRVRSSGTIGDAFAVLSIDDAGRVLEAVRFGFDVGVQTLGREDGHSVRTSRTVTVDGQFVPLRRCEDAARAIVIDRGGAIVAELDL